MSGEWSVGRSAGLRALVATILALATMGIATPTRRPPPTSVRQTGCSPVRPRTRRSRSCSTTCGSMRRPSGSTSATSGT